MAKRVLQILAVTLLAGGGVRLFANRALFEIVGIGDVWSDQAYGLYIYRVLGAFVVLVGIVVFMIARDPERYRQMLAGLAGAFLFVGIVMIVAGSVLALAPRFYLPDPLYCFAVAGLILIVAKAP
jgi:uncharacterized membrane protein